MFDPLTPMASGLARIGMPEFIGSVKYPPLRIRAYAMLGLVFGG